MAVSTARQAQEGGREGVRDDMADQVTGVELSLPSSTHQHVLQLYKNVHKATEWFLGTKASSKAYLLSTCGASFTSFSAM